VTLRLEDGHCPNAEVGLPTREASYRPYASMNWIRFNGSLRDLAVSQPLAGTPLVRRVGWTIRSRPVNSHADRQVCCYGV